MLSCLVVGCTGDDAAGEGSTGDDGTPASSTADPDGPGGDGPGSDGPGGDATGGDTTNGTDPPAPSGRVLMVVAYNNTWWPEYKVMREGLVAAGYEVEVRSSTAGTVAHSYGDRVDEVTPGLEGVAPIAYDVFRSRFEDEFGVAWDPAWNEPATIPLDGRIQDADMSQYAALVIPGGSGSQFLRYDGEYEDLPSPTDPAHVSPAADMAAAAAALDLLVVDALVQGSPVLAVCHAGPTPGFARVPGTEGQGPDGLGLSLLQGRRATGFPLEIEIFGAVGDVAQQYAALGIEFVPDQAVVVDGPGVDLDGDGTPDGEGLVVTARSWYPEEVLEGLQAMLDIL